MKLHDFIHHGGMGNTQPPEKVLNTSNFLPKTGGRPKKAVQENWRQVKEVFANAIRQQPDQRGKFLDRACSDDNVLRSEVESLLNSFDSAENFLETPAFEATGEFVSRDQYFAPGRKIAHYEIVKKLGTGGMGEVYLAMDTKLHRQVALKVLFQNLTGNYSSQGMLMREARAAATLDHPNICAIHEISETNDCSFIVMQYVEGQTLAEILANGPLGAERAIAIATQICDALEQAHSRRIIHRDIKPANIIVNEKDIVKVLDFGLAKFIEPARMPDSVKRLSTSGAIMGTVPYMSPEQLRGKPLDERTDIFSLGAMLYEMLSGRQAFSDDSHAEAISGILNDDPDLSKIAPHFRPILKRALMKDKRKRYQSASGLAADLRKLANKDIKSPKTNSGFWSWLRPNGRITSPLRSLLQRKTANNSSLPRFYRWKSAVGETDIDPNAVTERVNPEAIYFDRPWFGGRAFSAIAILLLAAGGLVWFYPRLLSTNEVHSFDSIRSVRLVSWNTGGSSIYQDYSSSHDGKMVAYSSNQNGTKEGIFIKQNADGKEIRITNDGWNNRGPIWSPDDQRIAFVSYRDGKSGIYSSPYLGGNTTLLKIVGEGELFLRYWSIDGSIIFYEYNGNLFRLNISSGDTQQLTDFSSSPGKIRYFSFSPDEKEVAYTDNIDGQPDIWLTRLDSIEPRRLTNDKDKEERPVWHPDGKRILYSVLRDDHLQINQISASGGAAPEQITRGDNEYQINSISADGTKIFYLTWEDKSDIWGIKTDTGEEFQVASSVESEFWPDVSPDGQSIVYQSNSSASPPSSMSNSKLEIRSLNNSSLSISISGQNPRWLPDGKSVAFIRLNETSGKASFFTVNTFNGKEEQVTSNSITFPNYAVMPYNRAQLRQYSWSPDSKTVAFLSKDSNYSNVLQTSLESKETLDITQNLDANVQYYSPAWSRSGKSLAFMSINRPSKAGEIPTWKVWLWEKGVVKEILSTAANLRLLGWTSEEDLLLESSDVPLKASPIEVKLLRISTNGAVKPESFSKEIYALSMNLSPDGKFIVFTSRAGDEDNLLVASTANWKIRKLTTNGNPNVFLGSPTFTPDGKTIYFDKQEKMNTISMFENFK